MRAVPRCQLMQEAEHRLIVIIIIIIRPFSSHEIRACAAVGPAYTLYGCGGSSCRDARFLWSVGLTGRPRPLTDLEASLKNNGPQRHSR